MELKKYKLADIGKVITGKTPSTSIAENYACGTIPFYTPEDVAKGLGMKGRNNRFITRTGFEEIASNTITGESVLVGCIGSDMGNVAYSNITCATNQQINSITQFINGVEPLYVYYLLSTMKPYFQKIAGSTTTPILPKSVFEEIEIHLPDIKIQKDVVSILYALDHKIELNKQINDNLEAMAKQLYDYWFVQFDFPNEEGKPYKSSGGAMVWNDKLKREIPQGWTSAKMKDVAQTYSGGTPTSTNSEYYDGGNIPWINSGELNNSIITSTTNYITEEGLKNSSAKLYPQDTVLVALYGATAGKVSLLSFEACSNQAVCGVIPPNKIMTTYIRYYLSSLYEHFITLSSGSARDNISQDTIKNTILPIPQEKILKEYSDAVAPIISKIIANQKEMDNLTKQRDELLPLLMNGQASVNYHLFDD